ncbi:MAG: rRNA pseudouridine synthase [Deltaproteobacteria bacterium]|jgi:pseudouridine synthase|nr:rRNA pseudouridine synthase [Deltaproteobacteria bacterium]
MEVRLQKLLAEAGITSRRGAEELIRKGLVTVNGQKVTQLGAKASLGVDEILVDGNPLAGPQHLGYYMFHKPKGYLTALSDLKLKRPTVAKFFDHLPHRVYPVGRLDRDVSGFLILTNDGTLAARLMHPSYEVSKVYRALVTGIPKKKEMGLLRSGKLIICGKAALPAAASIIETYKDSSLLELTLTEGRHRQVKRMLKAIGHPVIELERISYAGIELDPKLSPGQLRELLAKEIKTLKDRVGL